MLAVKRRSRYKPLPTGKQITLQPRDIFWLEKLHRHGDLSTPFLLAYSAELDMAENRARDRLTDLCHEPVLGYGARVLSNPKEQYETFERNQHRVYGVSEAGTKALKALGLYHTSAPVNSHLHWYHDFIISCVTASIELACLKSERYRYIFHDEIVEENGALQFAFEYEDGNGNLRKPKTRRFKDKDQRIPTLIPDRSFGIYDTKEKSKRYFLLEVDRATETANSSDSSRKSVADNIYQYRQFIGGLDYKEQMKYQGGLVGLHVFTNETRMHNILKLVPPANYLACKAIPFFSGGIHIASPMPELFTEAWLRPGRGDFFLNK